ncbi:PE-PPE domain-containing protein [Mycobacterium sp. ITM-2016-00316]|uniref:PE-PPE domain-containing protein n=1 Tax=Mycobacterium sp. ITM-2016-00316 TaxID=2099695 RepID=UPI000CF87C89|nr:PE-PPE domain-containing protein [Mycobacterium sp. ITM-2016-00316]WNG81715.1 PE-PPE domain-containing protein [Mycobacterium sp. ITM-2016-00316]
MAGSRLRTLTTGLFAVVVSIALVCGQAIGANGFGPLVGLVNTVIGIGGSSDPVSERLPAKLSNTIVQPGDTYIGTEYPASLNLDRSVRIGMPVLHQQLVTTSGKVLVAGYSLGALLAEQLKRDVAESDAPPSPLDLSFLQIATPFVPNGGIFARFPGIAIPDVVSPMGPGQATQYDTTYVVNEYDLWGDFPAYFNPVAILNAVLGHEYAHVDNWYDAVDPTAEANHVKVVTNSAGGTDTYILVPASRLPLLAPLRDMAYHLGVSAAAERLLGAIEPLLRIIVDMGYTDRLNLNPEVRKPFSLFTPPHKIVEALNAVPGAVREGLENLLGITRNPAAPAVAPPAAAAAVQPASQPESAVQSEAPPEAEATSDDDELEAPPSARKTPGRPVVTLRDGPRSTFGGNRTGPKTAQSPARSQKSGQDTRDAGAEAA